MEGGKIEDGIRSERTQDVLSIQRNETMERYHGQQFVAAPISNAMRLLKPFYSCPVIRKLL